MSNSKLASRSQIAEPACWLIDPLCQGVVAFCVHQHVKVGADGRWASRKHWSRASRDLRLRFFMCISPQILKANGVSTRIPHGVLTSMLAQSVIKQWISDNRHASIDCAAALAELSKQFPGLRVRLALFPLSLICSVHRKLRKGCSRTWSRLRSTLTRRTVSAVALLCVRRLHAIRSDDEKESKKPPGRAMPTFGSSGRSTPGSSGKKKRKPSGFEARCFSRSRTVGLQVAPAR